MFATGIENSIPTIDNGRTRVDQMDSCRHYKHWRLDFDCVEELGLQYLRYGPPLHTTYLGPGRHDWEFADGHVAMQTDAGPNERTCRETLPFSLTKLDGLPLRHFPEAPIMVRPDAIRHRKA